MSPTGQNNMLRSIGAILAGLVAILVLSFGTNTLLSAVGIFPAMEFSRPNDLRLSDLFYVLATISRTVYWVIGSYIAARLAPRWPMIHALVLGSIGVALNTAAAVLVVPMIGPFGGNWYPVTIIAITLPCAWIGGKLVSANQAVDTKPPSSVVG